MDSRTRPRGIWGSAALLLIAVASFHGCAYSVRNSSLPPHLKTLAIPTFGNNTVEFGLSDDITTSLLNGFLADHSLRIVQERDANAVLRGAVVAYRNQVFGYTSQERATEYEIVLTVSITFRDMVKNRDLWKDDALTVRTTYNVTAVGGQPAQTETEGRRDAIQKLTDRVVSRTVQGW
ncbi:MAG TPA: LPS assembly lipoprotein LptE [Candidatus Polarisedimenticolia bacterium]|nr:LPS assembly lipoprotein LptE [Candidatus Polarisedimenticolia bacterium]